ncbi:MAG: YHS domain-containing protein [Bacteroidota bacterium]
MTHDPVCGMQIDEDKAAQESDYQGTTHYFCSSSCKASFDKNPTQYIGTHEEAATHHHHHKGRCC